MGQLLLLLLTITATPSGEIPSPWTCSSPSPSSRRHCCLNCWLAISCPAESSHYNKISNIWCFCWVLRLFVFSPSSLPPCSCRLLQPRAPCSAKIGQNYDFFRERGKGSKCKAQENDTLSSSKSVFPLNLPPLRSFKFGYFWNIRSADQIKVWNH